MVRFRGGGFFKNCFGNKKGKPYIDKLLEEHTKKYCWLELGYKFLDEPLTKKDFELRLQRILKSGISKLPTEEEIDIETRRIVRELEIDMDHIRLFKALGKITYLKEFRDGIYARSHHEFHFLLREILKRFGITKDVVRHWRKKNKHKSNSPMYAKICIECDKPFISKRRNAVRCPSCKEIQRQIYYAICQLRADFREAMEINPEKAKEIARELEKLEGKAFKNLAIDGLADNPQSDSTPDNKDNEVS